MKFNIKNPDGVLVRQLDIKTSLREDYVFQDLSESLPDIIARPIAKTIVWLADEPAANSATVARYTVEKVTSAQLDIETSSLSKEHLDRFQFHDIVSEEPLSIPFSELTWDEQAGYPDRGTREQQIDYMRKIAARRRAASTPVATEEEVLLAKLLGGVPLTPKELVTLATEAANEAGDKWMAAALARGPKYSVHQGDLLGNQGPTVGYMLDVCGNGHVQFKDKRAGWYKQFVKAGCVRKSGNAVVEINHKYLYRQEMGLMVACADAAKAKLEELGVTGLHIWSYID